MYWFTINELKMLENALISEYHLTKGAELSACMQEDNYLKEVSDLTEKVRNYVLDIIDNADVESYYFGDEVISEDDYVTE